MSTVAPGSKPLPVTPTLEPWRTVLGFSNTNGLATIDTAVPCIWTTIGFGVGPVDLATTVVTAVPPTIAGVRCGPGVTWPAADAWALAPVVSTATSSPPDRDITRRTTTARITRPAPIRKG